MFLKKLLFTAGLTALTALLGSTSSSAQEKKTVGLAVANLQADFFNQIKQSVDAEAKAKGLTSSWRTRKVTRPPKSTRYKT